MPGELIGDAYSGDDVVLAIDEPLIGGRIPGWTKEALRTRPRARRGGSHGWLEGSAWRARRAHFHVASSSEDEPELAEQQSRPLAESVTPAGVGQDLARRASS